MDTHVDEARLQALLAQSRALHSRSGQRSAPDTVPATGDDIAALQTAASLENVAVSLYSAALNLETVVATDPTVQAFILATRNQHADHAAAFNAAVTQAGGMAQTNPDPRYDAIVQAAPLTTVADVVTLAAMLEDAAAQTYVRESTIVSLPALRSLFGSVAAVEAQHEAILLALGALLVTTPPDDVTLHPVVARLPAAIGSVGFPAAVTPVTDASPPDEGALR